MESVKQGYSKATALVVSLCWFLIVFEGYDLVMYGTVVPSILADKSWAVTPAQAGHFGSYVVIGMLIGALAVGTMTDHFGRKKTLLVSAAFCALFMVGTALAPTPQLFGLGRFLTGVGLGGVMPTITVLTLEYAPKAKKTFTVILMYTGYNLGGIFSSLLALKIIHAFGWRSMFWIGLIPLIIVIPLAAKFLPESISYLLSKGKQQEAQKVADRLHLSLESLIPPHSNESVNEGKGTNSITPLFSKRFRVSTLAFWLASFVGLYLIFGLNTWLPTIMRTHGYSLGSSLTFMLVLNIGVIFGNLLTGYLTDRLGTKSITFLSFFIGFISLGLLSLKPSSLVVTYILFAFAGIGSFGTQNLINAFVGDFYPVKMRGTALGWSLGIGRFGGILAPIVGGWLVTMAAGLGTDFGVFAILGLIGGISILFVSNQAPETATVKKVV